MRHWFGDPVRIFASFPHRPRDEVSRTSWIGLYILAYANVLPLPICDDVWPAPARERAAARFGNPPGVSRAHWMARARSDGNYTPPAGPSTIDDERTQKRCWEKPRWNEAWFPDAFAARWRICCRDFETDPQPNMPRHEILLTMALVRCC